MLPGSSVHGILQARIQQWVAMSSSRGVFPTQGLNPGLLYCRRILHCLNHQGNPFEGIQGKQFGHHHFVNKPSLHLLFCSRDGASLLFQLIMAIYHWKMISVQFSCSVVFDSLRPHGLQHARPPCPSPTPVAYSNLCPLNR